VRTGVFFKPQPYLDEKEMGNKYKKHMPVPGIPGTRLAMTHSQVTFALLKALLNWPAQSSCPVKLFHRDVGWGIT